MFSPEIKLEKLIQPVASCDYQSGLSAWIAVILDSPQDLLIITDDEQRPQGLFTKTDLLSLITEFASLLSLSNLELINSESLQDLLKPLVCLSSTTTVGQFLAHFKNNVDHKNYVIVDKQGKLLGRINIAELLKTCSQVGAKGDRNSEQLVDNQKSNLLKKDTQQPYSSQSKNNLLNQKVINSHSCNLPINYDSGINDQEISFFLFSLLNQIVLPLQIKNINGEVCYANRAWQQEFGAIFPIANSNRKKPPIFESTNENQTLTPGNPKQSTLNQLEQSHCSQANNFLISPLSISSKPVAKAHGFDQSSLNRDQSTSGSFPGYKSQNQDVTSHLESWSYHELPFSITNNSLYLDKQPQYCLIFATKATYPQEIRNRYILELQTNLQKLQHQFFLSISHDLKSPLTSIVGLSSLLNEEKLGKLNENQMRYSKMIYHSGKKLICLVNDFLSINRLTIQNLTIDTEEIALSEMLNNVYQQICQKLQEIADTQENNLQSRHHLELSVSKAAQTVSADRVCLQQILTRLLENVISSCPQDQGIKITGEFWSEQWLAISICAPGKILSLNQPAFLGRELQSDRHNFLASEEDKQILGLCLAQQLAQFHGGDISVITQENHPNQLTILLPQANSIGHADSANLNFHQNLQANNNNSLIVIFDSDMSRILSWQQNLAELGYYLLVASSAEDLIYKAICFQPHKIIMDSSCVTLETGNLVEQLNLNLATQNIPLIYVDRCSASCQSLDRVFLTAIQQKCEQVVTVPIATKLLQQIFPAINQEIPPIRKSLTVMRLAVASKNNCLSNCILDSVFENPSFCLCHHIIEADSLEQAYLLARIWKIDAIIWDGQMLEQPENHLKSLAKNNLLATIPIITLDKRNTAIANQISNLDVFPCLLPVHERSIERLTQVIQIAAGVN